jgi:fatty-acyl-CoA synthase
MARRDAGGYIWLVDRKSNMIINGTENVYPSEVECVLGAYPKIHDVVVICVSHPKWGEAVASVMVPHDGQQMIEEEVIDWCRNRIAGYKRPRQIVFRSEHEMPRTATGKILHRILRERISWNEPALAG